MSQDSPKVKKKRSRRKWWIGGFIALLVIGLIVFWRSQQQPAAITTDAPGTSTAVVMRGDLTVHVYASGTVQANRTVDIRCQAGGEVTNLPYDLGETVKQGAIVLQVDPESEQRDYVIAQRTLEQSQLNANSAQLNLEAAQQNLDNNRRTYQSNLISDQAQVDNDQVNLQRDDTLLRENLASQQAYDDDKTTLIKDQQALQQAQVQIDQLKTQELQIQLQKLNVQLAQVQVESDQEAAAQAKLNLSYTTVIAPIAGIVSEVLVQPGQVISSALTNVGGGTDVMTLVDLSHVFVLATVNESDINKVHAGQNVQITAAGAPGKVFNGVVQLIGPVGTADAKTSVIEFQVKIEVVDPNKALLLPGMTANLDIQSDQLKNVLYVPLQAVRVQHGQYLVDIVDPEGNTTVTNVTVGDSNDQNWQIISGLKEGQKVVVHENDLSSVWHNL
jgi:HlyD family secretion protein